MKNAMLPGLGGPMGRHARPRGAWFNPVPWAVLAASLLWVVVVLRHIPCVRTESGNTINAFIRLCYSDTQLIYIAQGFGLGKTPMGTESMLFPPVLAVLMLASVKLTAVFGAQVSPTADLQTQLDSSVAFLAVTAVLLFLCFLGWVLCMVLLGRESRNGRYRSWDAMLVAASPVVLCAGFVHWDLLPIALSALGLLQFAQRRSVEAGIILGLAASSGTMGIAVVLAVATAVVLRGNGKQLAAFAGPAVATWLLVHLPLLLNNTSRVYDFYVSQVSGEKSYGSLWYLLQVTGWSPKWAGALGFMLLVLVLIATVCWLYLTHRRPRVGTLVAGFVFATALSGAAYPPQMALWLLFALVLARPFKPELLAFTLTQVGYYLALHGWLSGHLTPAKGGPDRLYYLILGLRAAVELWVLVQCYRDMADPARDELRAPDHSDPIGGELVDGEELAPVVARAA